MQDGRMRLVSLLPSATEIVYALGLGDDLVGVTFECDEPTAVRSEKAVVVGGRDTSGMTPAEIDSYVRDQLANGEDLYTLHADALDHLGCRAGVLSLDPHTLGEVLDTILAVGERTGVADRAEQVVASLRS